MLTAFFSLTAQDHLLRILAISIALLLLLALAFSCSAILLRRRNRRRAAHWLRLEQEWQAPVFAALAGEPAAPPAVAPADAARFLDYLLRLRQRLRGVEAERLSQLALPYLRHIEGQAANGDAEQRARAVQTLGQLAAGRYETLFLAALQDRSPLVAMTAARALATTAGTRFLPELLAVMPRFALWQPRYLAALLARPPASDQLLACFTDAQAPVQTRLVAAEALRQLHHAAAAAPAAALAATTTSDRELRAAALRLLAAVGTAEQLPTVRLLLRDPDAILRGQAAAALAAFGLPADAPFLRPLLDDASVWVAMAAARALQRLHGAGELARLAAAGHPRAALFRQLEQQQ